MANVQWQGDEFKKRLRSEIEKRLATAGEVVKAEVVQSMSISGRSIDAAAKWGTGPITSKETLKVGKHKRVYIFRSRPGEIPHVQTAQLLRSIFSQVQASLNRVIIGTPLKYGADLEKGTTKMAARPFLRPALNASMQRIRQIFAAPLPPK